MLKSIGFRVLLGVGDLFVLGVVFWLWGLFCGLDLWC